MGRIFILVVACIVAGCANLPPPQDMSPCAMSEASYECQVERYRNVEG